MPKKDSHCRHSHPHQRHPAVPSKEKKIDTVLEVLHLLHSAAGTDDTFITTFQFQSASTMRFYMKSAIITF